MLVSHSNAQDRPKTEVKLKQAGAVRIDDTGVKFRMDKAILTLEFEDADLAAITIEFEKPTSKIKRDEMVELANKLRPLGPEFQFGVFGAIGPSGTVTRQFNYAHGFIVQKERTCRAIKKDKCRIVGLVVFYWLPFKDTVIRKRTESIEILGTVILRHWVAMNSGEFEVSETDYERLTPGKVFDLERTIFNRVRIVPTHPIDTK